MAKRAQFDDVVIDLSGNALDNVEVTIYENDGTSVATIYSGKTGGSPITNPITTDATGLVSFYAEPGEYILSFHDAEFPQRVDDRTKRWQAISGDTSGISGSQIEDDGITASKLATDVLGIWETILSAEGYLWDTGAGNPTAQTYLIGATGVFSGTSDFGMLSANSFGVVAQTKVKPPPIKNLKSADYALSGAATQIRVRATIGVNGTATGRNFQVGIVPLTISGADDNLLFTGALAGSPLATINAPAINDFSEDTSAAASLPSNGKYALAVLPSGTLANNSAITVHAELQINHV
jgi:hypothetical protein